MILTDLFLVNNNSPAGMKQDCKNNYCLKPILQTLPSLPLVKYQ